MERVKITIYMIDGNTVEINGTPEDAAALAQGISEGSKSGGVVSYTTGDGKAGYIYHQHVVRVEISEA